MKNVIIVDQSTHLADKTLLMLCEKISRIHYNENGTITHNRNVDKVVGIPAHNLPLGVTCFP